jgi:hypothetical protein
VQRPIEVYAVIFSTQSVLFIRLGGGAKIGARYRMNKRFTLSLDANYRNWVTDGGTDEKFFSDGSSRTIKLNKAKWRRNGINLGLNWRF